MLANLLLGKVHFSTLNFSKSLENNLEVENQTARDLDVYKPGKIPPAPIHPGFVPGFVLTWNFFCMDGWVSDLRFKWFSIKLPNTLLIGGTHKSFIP